MNRYTTACLILIAILTCSAVGGDDEQLLFVVHFTTGPNWDQDQPPAAQDGFQGHSSNLGYLREQGKIAFGARYGEYGMIFFASDSIDAARQILDKDPGVVAGIFTYEIAPMNVFYPWRESK